MRKVFFILVGVLIISVRVLAAVGCDLNDPDRDVKRIFPQSTSYKTTYFSLKDKEGEILQKQIETRLGDKFKGLFENVDVPYTLYTIYRGKELIGYIHGVNQKGEFGGLQVFLALSPSGTINNVYFQKLTSQKAAVFRSKTFTDKFIGFDLSDFNNYDVVTHQVKANQQLASIIPSSTDTAADLYAILRGIKKNLILMDEFVFNNSHSKNKTKKGSATNDQHL